MNKIIAVILSVLTLTGLGGYFFLSQDYDDSFTRQNVLIRNIATGRYLSKGNGTNGYYTTTLLPRSASRYQVWEATHNNSNHSWSFMQSVNISQNWTTGLGLTAYCNTQDLYLSISPSFPSWDLQYVNSTNNNTSNSTQFFIKNKAQFCINDYPYICYNNQTRSVFMSLNRTRNCLWQFDSPYSNETQIIQDVSYFLK